MSVDHLAAPGFERLWRAVRASLERTGGAVAGTVSLAEPTRDERVAIGGLLRRPVTAQKRLTLPLATLDHAVRIGPAGLDLVEVVQRLTGPLRDRPAETAAALEARSALRASVLAAAPDLAEWLDALDGDGTLTRLRDGLAVVALAAEILAVLPTDATPLAVFAARTAGHAKRLDTGPLPTLVLRGLALRLGEPTPRSTYARRSLWDANGVVVDPLSSQALVLGLGESADGEPRRWTLRQLRHGGVPSAAILHVCENPAVLAVAADRLGATCPPFLCTEGQPSTAVRLVVDAAAEVRWHNDWDWPGIRMTAAAVSRHRTVPWHMEAWRYEAALATTDPSLLRRLEGKPAATPWDPSLAAAMTAHGVAVEEEAVVAALVDSLVGGGRP